MKIKGIIVEKDGKDFIFDKDDIEELQSFFPRKLEQHEGIRLNSEYIDALNFMGVSKSVRQ